MRKILTALCVMLLTLIFISAEKKQELTGEELAQKIDTREQPKTMKATMTMVLIDKKGNKRERKVSSIREGDEKMLMWFLAPADEKGVSFLRKSYEDRDDDMWLYLPAFGKVRRIASHAKKGNFMGTDFTYEDMGDRKIKNYTYKILKEEKIDNKDYWVLEWTPKENVDTDYSKIISWVWKENYSPIIEEFYDKTGEKKKIKKMDVEKKDKYWLPVKMVMEDIKANHKTEMYFEDIKVDEKLEDSVFTTSYMQRVR
ncbi:MAG: outer membrane lipoprotein-sorting protein [Candidatus Goldbacteria bacterium]|nr:outer membrane lipoprotein-sorting protein [Candidatus Goldiibacteriota bacterium]